MATDLLLDNLLGTWTWLIRVSYLTPHNNDLSCDKEEGGEVEHFVFVLLFQVAVEPDIGMSAGDLGAS